MSIFFKFIKNVCVITSFLFFVFVVSVLILPESADALGLFTNFGGKITTVVPCTNGVLITVVGPKPGVFLYKYFVSKLYPAFQLLPKAKVIGRAINIKVPCTLMPPAANIPSEGVIISVGTSSVLEEEAAQ